MIENPPKQNHLKNRTAAAKYILVIVNIILILASILFSWNYSQSLRREQEQSELDAFCATIESMKQIADNYLKMELGYAKGWAQYINQKEMTIEEALDYIDKSNSQEDRYAHIVNMETFEGYSSYGGSGPKEVFCYRDFYEKQHLETYQIFVNTMEKMFSEEDGFNLLGKYRADDTQTNVVSVGTKVTLVSQNDKKRDYLLLCVIPLERIRNIWVFPMEYRLAEVGIITKNGDYAVPSKSMRSKTFVEFLWGYNFLEEYGKVEELLDQLASIEKGVLEYKDSKDQQCYWYYSSFGEGSTLDILGYIPIKNLKVHETNWMIVLLTCGVLIFLAVMDGMYLFQMNKRLRETAKLAEEASQAKSQFLSTMSHDIRTPMNGIIGMTNIAKEHLYEPEYVRNCLDKVLLTSDHLLTLINDILDISKVESGNMTLTPAVFSIKRSIEKLIDIVQVQMDEKNLLLETQIEIPEPYLIADELRLNQIFINILTNAVKYTPSGGTIRLSVSEKMLPDGRVRLIYCVADTGIGMTEAFQKSMYQKFVREIDSRIGKIQGTGLGLSIVKQMVDLMGGSIQCESVVNEGTTFTITIDLERGDEAEYQKLYGTDAKENDDFGGLRVLVAEDNDLNWEISCELLRSLGVSCDRAQNGKECIQMLEASKDKFYDLVFMDIQMPVMNGKEAARRIRQSSRPYIKQIRIIAMTADAFAEDIQECMAAGMDGHISKPVDVRKVLEALKQVKYGKEGNHGEE